MIRHAVVSSSRAALTAGAVLALTAATPAVAAAPDAAAPGSGGTSAGSHAAAPAPAAKPRRSQARIRLFSTRTAGVVGARAVYVGRVLGAQRGTRVHLELRRGTRWRPVARDFVSAKGRFRISKQIAGLGDQIARLRVKTSERVDGTKRRVSRLHGFRRTHASYFGPGLYGSALACGGRLSPSTRGVAHKTLPCGSRVTLRHGTRQVTTRVVDRGPYISGREFDLTTATRNALGFGDIGTVLVDR